MNRLLKPLLLILLFCRGSSGQDVSSSGSSGRRVLGSALQTCEFPTVRTDEKGNIVERRTGSARCYDENLGNGITLKMIEVPEGDFLMGSPETEVGRNADEGPQHKVHVKRFFIGQFEVTDQQWQTVRKLPRV